MECILKCLMCSMKYTDAVSDAFVGAGTVRNVHFSVCSVLPAKDGIFDLKQDKSNLNFICQGYFSKTNSPTFFSSGRVETIGF